MWIAVMAGIAEQRATAAQKRKVHAPRVDADRIDSTVVRGTFSQCTEDFAVQAEHVPMQGIKRRDGSVREAVNDFELDPLTIEPPHYATPALGAEIDCQYVASRHFGSQEPGSGVSGQYIMTAHGN